MLSDAKPPGKALTAFSSSAENEATFKFKLEPETNWPDLFLNLRPCGILIYSSGFAESEPTTSDSSSLRLTS